MIDRDVDNVGLKGKNKLFGNVLYGNKFLLINFTCIFTIYDFM